MVLETSASIDVKFVNITIFEDPKLKSKTSIASKCRQFTLSDVKVSDASG